MPLGGVIASPKVAEPFFGQPGAMWRHGYTYSGHAAACVAGLEVMGIYEREGVFDRALELETEIPRALASLTDLDPVIGIRSGVGAMAAIQLDPSDPTLAMKVTRLCRQEGLITRAIAGNGLQISPPLIMTTAQVDEMAEGFRAGLSAL
jgi:adenosylmethionine-8-amino-7-oxononanoate aminotransferase